MKKIIWVLAALTSLNILAGTTYTVATSNSSLESAQQQCSFVSPTTGLPAGRPVGYSLRVGNNFYVVCERNFQDYENLFSTEGQTFTVSVSDQSFEHARWQCQNTSSTTGLPGGRHLGFPLLNQIQQQAVSYAVVCIRPNRN